MLTFGGVEFSTKIVTVFPFFNIFYSKISIKLFFFFVTIRYTYIKPELVNKILKYILKSHLLNIVLG